MGVFTIASKLKHKSCNLEWRDAERGAGGSARGAGGSSVARVSTLLLLRVKFSWNYRSQELVSFKGKIMLESYRLAVMNRIIFYFVIGSKLELTVHTHKYDIKTHR